MKTSRSTQYVRLRPKALLSVALGITASLVLVFGMLTPGNVEATGRSTDPSPAQFDNSIDKMIQCGLWFGSNFDIINGAKCSKIARVPESSTHTQAAPPAPAPPPQPPTVIIQEQPAPVQPAPPAPSPEPAPAMPAEPAMPPTDSRSSHSQHGDRHISGRYVALGDSVPAGLGLTLSSAAADTCGRSSQGYPNLVAGELGLTLINVSCSGATVGDLVTKQSVEGPNLPAQLDTAFSSGTPGLITITAGANDVHWADFVGACYTTDCTGSAYQTAAQAYLAAMKVKLATALSQINSRSNNQPPQVIITGYYMPLSTACVNEQQGITAQEITWLNSNAQSLNQAIRSVSKNYSYVRFVHINFTGHDVCSSDSWVQGLQDQAPFHPTAVGQDAIAKAVLAKVNR